MYVLLDIEWISRSAGENHVTQIAAARVDEEARVQQRFSALIAPTAATAGQWRHIAYGGYDQEEIGAGRDFADAVAEFDAWLNDDDRLLLWTEDAAPVLALILSRKRPFAFLERPVRRFERRLGDEETGLYTIAEDMWLEIPLPKHRAVNDVAVLVAMVEAIGFDRLNFNFHGDIVAYLAEKEKTRLRKERRREWRRRKHADGVAPPFSPAATREDNVFFLSQSPAHFFFTAASPVFHRRDCYQLRRVTAGLYGEERYDVVTIRRRPCKCCRPRPDVEEAPPTFGNHGGNEVRRPDGKGEERSVARPAPPTSEERVVERVRLLGGKVEEVNVAKIVGTCHNLIHPGKMTVRIMTEHGCLEKECPFFKKNEGAAYWRQLEARQRKKAAARRQRRQKKAAEQAKEAEAEALRRQLQQIADEEKTPLLIVKVKVRAKGVCTVFYVSDRDFSDNHLYEDFITKAKDATDCYVLSLRHIRDKKRKYVTIAEYAALKGR